MAGSSTTPKALVRRAVKHAASAVDRLVPVAPGVVVLIYHRVGGGSGLEIDLDPGLFDEQMAMLAADARLVSLADAARMLTADSAPVASAPPVVVTFDDGTADFADVALPILVRHQVPVTLYLATAHIEDQLPFPNDGVPLAWSAVREAASTGLVNVASHTHTHALLDRLDPLQIDDELDRSVDLIGERVGVAAVDFAYPKALAPSPSADRAVRARFRTAALAGTRINRFGRTDLHRLARSPVQCADGMRWFRQKQAGGMRLEDAVRRVANRRRYAGATT